MTKRAFVLEYRKKYPDMPTLKLARIIYKENNLMFKDVESVRECLRAIENKKGKNKTGIKSDFINYPVRPKNPYNLPESHEEKREAFILPKACNNILLISDLHIPYHNIEAVTMALDYGKSNNVNTIFINGDLIDNHQVSRFETDPKKRSVKRSLMLQSNF